MRNQLVIGIVGSRRRDDLETHELGIAAFVRLCRALRQKKKTVTAVVSGGAQQGLDRLAPLLAKRFGLTLIVHFPDYKTFGRIAPFMRNTKVAHDADYLIAAVHRDRTGGTEDTVKKFLRNHPESRVVLVRQRAQTKCRGLIMQVTGNFQ